jgi:hypothetical protein
VISIVLGALGTVAVAARCYSRYSMKVGFGNDDWTATNGLILQHDLYVDHCTNLGRVQCGLWAVAGAIVDGAKIDYFYETSILHASSGEENKA